MKLNKKLFSIFLGVLSSVIISYADSDIAKNTWIPTLFTTGLTVESIRLEGVSNVRAFVKLKGYNEVQIDNITTTGGKNLYTTALTAMTSGVKVSVYVIYSSAWPSGSLYSIGLSNF